MIASCDYTEPAYNIRLCTSRANEYRPSAFVILTNFARYISEQSSGSHGRIPAPRLPHLHCKDRLNKTFQFEKTDMGLQNIQFERKKSDYYVVLGFIDSSKEEHPIGMNDQFKIFDEHTFGLPMAVVSSVGLQPDKNPQSDN